MKINKKIIKYNKILKKCNSSSNKINEMILIIDKYNKNNNKKDVIENVR